jgi:hypothetical protein
MLFTATKSRYSTVLPRLSRDFQTICRDKAAIFTIFAATRPRFSRFLPRQCRDFSHFGLSRHRDFWPKLPRQIFAPGHETPIHIVKHSVFTYFTFSNWNKFRYNSTVKDDELSEAVAVMRTYLKYLSPRWKKILETDQSSTFNSHFCSSKQHLFRPLIKEDCVLALITEDLIHISFIDLAFAWTQEIELFW